MTDGGSMTDISPSTFTAAGEKVAGLLERAAIPGKPPVAVPGTSPADTAAATLATTMGTRITAASAELAPPRPGDAHRGAVRRRGDPGPGPEKRRRH
jgi:hypothetical protein